MNCEWLDGIYFCVWRDNILRNGKAMEYIYLHSIANSYRSEFRSDREEKHREYLRHTAMPDPFNNLGDQTDVLHDITTTLLRAVSTKNTFPAWLAQYLASVSDRSMVWWQVCKQLHTDTDTAYLAGFHCGEKAWMCSLRPLTELCSFP